MDKNGAGLSSVPSSELSFETAHESYDTGLELEPPHPLRNVRVPYNLEDSKRSSKPCESEGSPTAKDQSSRRHSAKSSLSSIIRFVKTPTTEILSFGKSSGHKAAAQSISCQTTCESFELDVTWRQMVNSLRSMYGTYPMVGSFHRALHGV